jgi:hypothetical protein
MRKTQLAKVDAQDPLARDGAINPAVQRQEIKNDVVSVGGASPTQLDDGQLQVAVVLGAEHTAWRRDRLSPSNRAKRLLEKIKPFIIKVLSFWDHRISRLAIEGRELFIDSSGSYQVI